MNNLKYIPISTLIITYLFVCGGLYLIGYWSTFDVDIFSLISIYDIPKSFIYPLFITQGFVVLNFIAGKYVNFNKEDEKFIDNFISINQEWSDSKKKFLIVITSISLWVYILIQSMICFIPNYSQKWYFWFISCTVCSYYLLYRFVNLAFIKKTFKYRILIYLIGHMLIFLPINSFLVGKIKSYNIKNNSDLNYVTISNIKTDTVKIKLLGFINDKIICCTLDNQKIHILNKDKCDNIILSKKKN